MVEGAPAEILIVDDIAENLSLLASILSPQHYEVRFAVNGPEALDSCRQTAPDLILLDINMPGMDGFQVCQALRESPSTRDVPVIFVTARDSAGDLVKGLELGAVDYLTKPIRAGELLARVRSHLALKQARDTIAEQNRQLQSLNQVLQRSQEDLLIVLDQLRLGALILGDAGDVRFVSRGAESLLGVSPAGLLERSWEAALPLDESSLDKLRAALALPGTQGSRLSLTRSDTDGRRFHLECDIQNDPRFPGQHLLYLYDRTELYDLREALVRHRHGSMLGNSPPMARLREIIERVAMGDWTVLIQGETGTGKELVAHAVHQASARRGGPFIAVNCAGLSESLIASQLFGHRRGAFTGAVNDQEGLFEAAAGGTLFLDEIGDVPPAVQVSLLRVLQEREVTRIGESRVRKVDTRVVVATHRDLLLEVREGRFREDLLYRLRVARLQVPPLRERRDDIPLLVSAFLKSSQGAAFQAREISVEAMNYLRDYHWPGNVRELRNVVEYLLIHCHKPVVEPLDLPPELLDPLTTAGTPSREPDLPIARMETGTAPSFLQSADEREQILTALRRCRGNRSRAAELLGISRATFYRRLRELDIAPQKAAVYRRAR